MRPADTPAQYTTGPAVEYLQYARGLSATEPLGRVRLHQEALAEYRQQPDDHRKVRLVLAASFLEPLPDEMTQTRAMFRDLLQAGPAVSPGLEALLEMRLNEMETRLAAQKLAAQQQAELDAARAKIQALTTIEKTLDPSTDGKRGR